MATKLHSTLTGSDLHINKIDATTGTELTTPSETIYDARWLRKSTGGTVGDKVTISRTGSTAPDINQTSAGDIFITRNTGNQRFSVNQSGGTDVIGSANSNLQANASSTIVLSQNGTEKIRIDSAGNLAVNATAGNAKLYVNGSFGTAINTTAKTGAYAAAITDSTIQADAAGGTFQVTLPTAASIAGRQYTIKRINATNAVTVGCAGAETIDGAATKTLGSQWAAITVQSDGTNWLTLNQVGTVT